MLLIAFMGVLAGALPVKAEPESNPAHWLRWSDIPKSELELAQGRVTSYDLTIDASGKPMGCAITNPSGSEILDSTICKLLTKRAHYKPARDISNNVVPYVARGHLTWRIGEASQSSYSEDFPDVIYFSKNAKSKKSFDVVKIIEIQDDGGKIEACSIVKSSGVSALDQLSCAIAARPEVSTPIRDDKNKLVRGVRALNIGFLLGEEPQLLIR